MSTLPLSNNRYPRRPPTKIVRNASENRLLLAAAARFRSGPNTLARIDKLAACHQRARISAYTRAVLAERQAVAS